MQEGACLYSELEAFISFRQQPVFDGKLMFKTLDLFLEGKFLSQQIAFLTVNWVPAQPQVIRFSFLLSIIMSTSCLA